MEALKGPGRENQGGPGLRKGFWPGEFHGLYSPWGPKESDRTERLSLCFILQRLRVEGQFGGWSHSDGR